MSNKRLKERKLSDAELQDRVITVSFNGFESVVLPKMDEFKEKEFEDALRQVHAIGCITGFKYGLTMRKNKI